MICFDDLPSDPVLLKQRLAEIAAMVEALSAERNALADERDMALAQRDAAVQENEKLLFLLSQFKRTIFGRRSERIDPDQLQLILSDAERDIAKAAANENEASGQDDAGKHSPSSKAARPSANRNRGRLPLHLPRVEVVIDVESKCCPCCGGEMHQIGATSKEMFDVIPVQYRVKKLIWPRYGCRACESAVVQAPAPCQAVDGGMATEAFLAQIAVTKYAYHLPLYRQAQILAGQGIPLDRATLAFWMGRLAWWLRPLHELLLSTILSYPKLFADETPLPRLDPGRGKTKKCQLWSIAMDDRPWAGPAPPAVAYVFAEDRKGARALELFKGFSGILQVDGYAGYNGLVRSEKDGRGVTIAFCFAHARRKFYDVYIATQSEIAAEALRRIGELYAIEAPIRGRSAADRRAVRQSLAKPCIEELKLWLEARLMEVSKKSGLGRAIRYALSHWEGLIRFVNDGRIEIDNNTVERTIRPIGLGRKNHLFAGSPAGGRTWSILASLLNTARLNDIDPQVYLTDVLERIVSGRTKINELHELLPWEWKAARQPASLKAAA